MRFRKAVYLPADVSEVYAFHENVANVAKVMPPGSRVRRVQGSVPARPGASFYLEVAQFHVPLRWHGKWEVADPPRRLVDISRTFPFSRWRHEHRFDRADGGTRMTDTVEYELPWYLGGKLVGATLFQLLFAWMFAVRHRRTRACFTQR